jgi:hypothetical protein
VARVDIGWWEVCVPVARVVERVQVVSGRSYILSRCHSRVFALSVANALRRSTYCRPVSHAHFLQSSLLLQSVVIADVSLKGYDTAGEW